MSTPFHINGLSVTLLLELFEAAYGRYLRGQDRGEACDSCNFDSVLLLQTTVSKSSETGPLLGPMQSLAFSSLQVSTASGYESQMRMASAVVIIAVGVFLGFHYLGLGKRLYGWSFDSDRSGSRVPRAGTQLFMMQFASLAWKNVLVNTRTELPYCLRHCSACGCIALCPVIYMFLLTGLPLMIFQLSGQSKDLQTHFPMQMGRNYSDPDLGIQPSMGDYLYRELSDQAPDDDPLQALWHPGSAKPQGACFCRTLGIVGPRAAGFKDFAQQDYTAWAHGRNARASGHLSCPSNYTGTLFRVFSSTSEVDRMIGSLNYAQIRPQRSPNMDDRLCGLVVLENDPATAAVPKFAVRTNVSGMDLAGTVAQKFWNNRARAVDTDALAWYLQSGFLSIQDLVQRYVSHVRVGDSVSLPAPTFSPLPSAPYRENEVKEGIGGSLVDPGTPTNLFLVTIMLIAYFMIQERNSRQKELMRLMGLQDSSLALSWFALFALINLVTSLACSILVYSTVVERSDFVILFLIMYLTSLGTITIGMVVSSLFSSDRLGALMAYALYSCLGMVYRVVVPGDSISSMMTGKHDHVSPADPSTLYLVSFFPCCAFTLCMKTYIGLDSGRTGCTLRHLYTAYENYSVGGGLAMLVVDVLAWALIHLYLDQVIPHDVGTVRPWYFPATVDFWRESLGWGGEATPASRPSAPPPPAAQEGGLFESEDTAQLQELRQRNAVVSVRGLRKTFQNASGAEIHAVNGLSFTMYQGECFCLLGHNGAGKSTAMGMVTGMLEPTAGEIHVRGLKMPEQMAEARRSMGFCMQQNVLWDTLTVREHVLLFGALMGLSPSATEESCNVVLAKVELAYKEHSWATALSGGMKRKLNVALALVGDARVLLLDEPSAGMDPHTRRRLWGLLKQNRSERIMCLTTHYMDEADELGDRVCIMVHGKAACNGSNAFLKQQLGCGYLLNFVKVSENAANEPILAVVRSHCGQCLGQATSIGRELRLQLPFSAVPSFPAMMRKLDSSLGTLRLESYGVGISDLEEVFLRVANGEEDRTLPMAQPVRERRATAGETRPGQRPEANFAGQFVGLLRRRVNYGIRDSSMFWCQLLVPMILMGIGFAIAHHGGHQGVYGGITLDTAGWCSEGNERFGPTLVTVGVAADSGRSALSIARAWTVEQVPGVSNIVLNTSINSHPSASEFAEESSFAMYAYNASMGRGVFDGHGEGRTGGAPQFGAVLYSDDRVTLFPNTSAPHAGPALFNLHFTAAMKSIRAGGALPSMKIVNEPLPATASELEWLEAIGALLAGMLVAQAYAFIGAGIAGYVAMEREREVEHQIMVSGASRRAYHLSNMAFDSIFGLFSFVGTLVVLAWLGRGNGWCASPSIYATVTLLVLFIPAVCAFAYFWARLFHTSGGAFVGVLLIGMFVGSIGQELSLVLRFFPKTRGAGEFILWLTRLILPSSCVGMGLSRLAEHKDASRAFGLSPFSSFYLGTEFCPRFRSAEIPGLQSAMPMCIANAGDDCIMLVVDLVVYLLLLAIADWVEERHGMARMFQLFTDPACPLEMQSQEDEKVCAEKARVARLDPSTQVLLVEDVCKVYASSKGPIHAVRGISFAVDGGNVFGLLGTNGAGKTTTFKMICGQLKPCSGRIFVKGLDVSEDLDGVRKHIGYCPQFDALLELMTVREHLELYARIKGFSGPAIDMECAKKEQTLHLEEYTDSRAGQLSGGNKRKLQTAIALIGEPEVVFLDEPSAGMDPVARRRMWDVIQAVAASRRSSAVVLTTHSMEEADALCTRIGIQCSGQLRCLGSPQQLKEWYSTGLELNLRVQVPSSGENEGLCGEWGTEPNAPCHLGQAQRFVDSFFAGRELSRRGPPLKGEADSMLAAALAEWCLLEERADGLAAFLAETCGGREHATCVDRAAGSLRYKLTGSCLGGGPRPYAELFETFQRHRGRLRLEDFQLSQGTLEQTFNRLAAEDIAKRKGDDEDADQS